MSANLQFSRLNGIASGRLNTFFPSSLFLKAFPINFVDFKEKKIKAL